MNAIERLAENDAYEWAITGIKQADIAWKTENISGYHEAFTKAISLADISGEAKYLAKARQRLVKKGFTGEKTVKKFRKTRIALIIAGVAYVLHDTGYDKVLLENGRQIYRRSVLRTAQKSIVDEASFPESPTP